MGKCHACGGRRHIIKYDGDIAIPLGRCLTCRPLSQIEWQKQVIREEMEEREDKDE